jgi:hypothetical protein
VNITGISPGRWGNNDENGDLISNRSQFNGEWMRMG